MLISTHNIATTYYRPQRKITNYFNVKTYLIDVYGPFRKLPLYSNLMNFMLYKNLEILADVEMFDVYLQGTLIQHLKEHLLHGNMNRQDVIIYYTTVIIYI